MLRVEIGLGADDDTGDLPRTAGRKVHDHQDQFARLEIADIREETDTAGAEIDEPSLRRLAIAATQNHPMIQCQAGAEALFAPVHQMRQGHPHKITATTHDLRKEGGDVGVTVDEGESLAIQGIGEFLHGQEKESGILTTGKKITPAIVLGIRGKEDGIGRNIPTEIPGLTQGILLRSSQKNILEIDQM